MGAVAHGGESGARGAVGSGGAVAPAAPAPPTPADPPPDSGRVLVPLDVSSVLDPVPPDTHTNIPFYVTMSTRQIDNKETFTINI